MKQLLKKVIGTFSLRIASMLLAFATSIILARLLGVSDFGMYNYVISWISLLAIPATAGFDGLLGREIAIYQTKSQWSELSGLIRLANILSILVSTGLALITSLIVWYFLKEENFQLAVVFWIGMTALPWMALRKICRGTMRGLHQIVLGLLPEMLLGPLLLLIVIGAITLWGEQKLTATWIMGAYSGVTLLTLLISLVLKSKSLPVALKHVIPKYHKLSWLRYAAPFMLNESITLINQRVDILMLGALNGVEVAGLYVPINRGAQLIVFILIAFIGPLSPTIASLHSEGKSKKLQRILKQTNHLALLISGLFTLLLLGFGYQYLLIFGSDFTQGTTALYIRCIGRFLFTTVGISSIVLSMTGYAHLTALSNILGVMLNIILNAVLIPTYGINGAAFATTFSILIIGVLDALMVKQKIGINSTFFKI